MPSNLNIRQLRQVSAIRKAEKCDAEARLAQAYKAEQQADSRQIEKSCLCAEMEQHWLRNLSDPITSLELSIPLSRSLVERQEQLEQAIKSAHAATKIKDDQERGWYQANLNTDLADELVQKTARRHRRKINEKQNDEAIDRAVFKRWQQ